MTSWVRNLGKLGWAVLLFPVASTEVFSLWMGWSGGCKAASGRPMSGALQETAGGLDSAGMVY